ncbi:riboflavin kinase/FMN adenylyltransferase/translation initiation factor IF-2,TIGR00487 [Candidatus Kryptonium thompsonii]|nr:riboflavin kinase/FMN adenylyltransferase/translation initiation factor IF-2,TIGR00487 [Candidatus Kryptonium thompsoni]
MEVVRNINKIVKDPNSIVTVGVFDGVHIAHQEILRRMKEEKLKTGARTVLVTFDPHPQEVLHPNEKFYILTTIDERIELLSDYDLDIIFVVNFTPEFSNITAEEFCKEIMLGRIGLRKVIVGYNHAFGKNREGNPEKLKGFGEKYGFEVELIPQLLVENNPVSSSKIRSILNEGNVRLASKLLGRYYFINGVVVKGSGRGKELGIPTANIEPRPPVVTIMGHVDHGKTTLLDYIRQSNIVAGEAGGITQHIGAYQVTLPNGKQITFIDTPGHEAFTAMRARGAQVTDIVVLVVAADDAVMPQTVEAINHALAANVPIIVAINKIDKPGANPDKIKQQLAERGILVEDWGGKYQCVEISAKYGKNVDLLLEKILLEAELMELKANPKKRARGVVIESKLDKGRGPVGTVLVQTGTLKIGDPFVAGTTFGRVRAMFDERGNRVEIAKPSTPVQVIGFDQLPEAGDSFIVVEDEKRAREIANRRAQLKREQTFRQLRAVSLNKLSEQIKEGKVKELPIIIKADVNGSVEALSDSLMKLSTEEVKVRIIHRAVGAISESDVLLAQASGAIIIGFNVRPTSGAKKARRERKC